MGVERGREGAGGLGSLGKAERCGSGEKRCSTEDLAFDVVSSVACHPACFGIGVPADIDARDASLEPRKQE